MKRWQSLHNKIKQAMHNQTVIPDDYFQHAKTWYDDYYTTSLLRAKRYQIAFFTAMGLCAILVLAILFILPLQSTQLVVVHQGPSGYSWVTTAKPTTPITPNWARTEAEIAHYVTLRAGYDPLLYHQQTQAVLIRSTPAVARDYVRNQKVSNPQSPVKLLGTKGYRTVMINSILPLDSQHKNTRHDHVHQNLAQVNFTVADHALENGRITKTPYTALISWRYTGMPSNPQALITNWDGFEVTKYVIQKFNEEKA